MTNAQSIPLPQESESCNNTLDAIITAPVLSIRAMLFSLYAEGDRELKSRIEKLASDFTNLPDCEDPDAPAIAAGTEGTTTSDEHPDKEGATEPDLKVCDHCYDDFDPNGHHEEDECCYHDGKMKIEHQSNIWELELGVNPMNFTAMVGYDTDYYRDQYPDAFYWDCCGEVGSNEGCIYDVHRQESSCVQGIHEEYVEGMEEWGDSDSDESD